MDKRALILVGLGFGDEGKGTMTDFLARTNRAHTVIRYNGGSQAAHNVVDGQGRHHTFSQFGSGTFVPGAATYLSRFMLVDPIGLLEEGTHLEGIGVGDAFRRIAVDRGAMIVTPFHAAANQLREVARGTALHGSCGKGIGETMADSLVEGPNMLFVGDLVDVGTVRRKLRRFQDRKRHAVEELRANLPDSQFVRQRLWVLESANILDHIADRYAAFARTVAIVDDRHLKSVLAKPGAIIFEGAQGVLLDEWYGFHPHTTWSTTTSANAESLLREHGYDGQMAKIGILRAYATRHGTGPFPTEDAALTRLMPDAHNGMNAWQRGFRVGWFDLVATRYALDVTGGVDELAITNLDRLTSLPSWKIATSYQPGGGPVADLRQHFEVTTTKGAHSVSRIRKSRTPDLIFQESLTNSLSDLRPAKRRSGLVLNSIRNRVIDDYLQVIQQRLATPIGLLSNGPTATEKLVVRSSAPHEPTKLPLADQPRTVEGRPGNAAWRLSQAT